MWVVISYFFRTDKKKKKESISLFLGALEIFIRFSPPPSIPPMNTIIQGFHVMGCGVACSRNHIFSWKYILHLPNFRPSACAIWSSPGFSATPDSTDPRSLLTSPPSLFHYCPPPSSFQPSCRHLYFIWNSSTCKCKCKGCILRTKWYNPWSENSLQSGIKPWPGV